MIIFNGVDLENIAPVKIKDIHVGPIQITPNARQRIGMGQEFVQMIGGNRTVIITFALLTNDLNERFSQLQDIAAWADPFKSHELSLPMYEGERHLDCICTSYPDPSYRQWWESDLQLVFKTFNNPYWTSDQEIRAQCNVPFSIGGNAPPMIQIQRNLGSMVANQTYACNGKSMFFSKIPAGSMVIDLNAQTAQVSGSSIMQYFGKTSQFIDPVPGNMTITGTGNIIYRERWK